MRYLSSSRRWNSIRSSDPSPPRPPALVSRPPDWSTMVTPSGFMPGTDEATRLTIDWTCASDKRATGVQFDHDRGGRCGAVTHKHGGFGRGEVDTRLGDGVDLLDRSGDLGLARLAEALTLDRTADAHRQLIEDRIAAGRLLRQALAGEQHARLGEVLLADGQRAGALVDAALDAGLIERGGDRLLVGVGQPGEQRLLRRRRQRHPGERRSGDQADQHRHRRRAAHRRLRHQAFELHQRVGEAFGHAAPGGGERVHIRPACS